MWDLFFAVRLVTNAIPTDYQVRVHITTSRKNVAAEVHDTSWQWPAASCRGSGKFSLEPFALQSNQTQTKFVIAALPSDHRVTLQSTSNQNEVTPLLGHLSERSSAGTCDLRATIVADTASDKRAYGRLPLRKYVIHAYVQCSVAQVHLEVHILDRNGEQVTEGSIEHEYSMTPMLNADTRR
jgi:hypothetical protein